ncbi:MAG: tetratricopeptide repeat protein [Elusimicrobia bacterium]|nr:tetratricopeptide repeat protein [Elusimicrobiota bacterium]
MSKNDDVSAAALRLERAKELSDEGCFEEALALLDRPLPAAFRPEGDMLKAECLRNRGFLAAAASLYRGLVDRLTAPDRASWLDCCLGLVACLRSLGEVAEARRYWAVGSKVAAGKEMKERFALEGALIERAAGDFGPCLRKLRRHLARFQRERDWAGAGYVLWAIGGALRFAGDLAGSRRAFQQGLALSRRAGDASGQAYAWFGLGGVTRIQGRFAEAEGFYSRALRAMAGTEDVFGQAYAHCGLANVLRQRGRLAEAQRHYVKAHALYTGIGDPVDLAYVDWGLGQIHLRRGELGPAEKTFRAALAGFAKGGETRGIVLSETSLATLLHAKGRTNEAERVFDQAVRRARRAGIHTHLELFT